MVSELLGAIVAFRCAVATVPDTYSRENYPSLFAPQLLESVSVPAGSIAVSLTKALEYDLKQKGRKGDLVIGVIFNAANGQSVEMKDQMLSSFGPTTVFRRKVVPIAIAVTNANDVLRAIDSRGLNVILLMPGTSQHAPEIARIGNDRKILTVAAVSAYLEYGIALSFDIYRKRVIPTVLVAATKRQGANFDAGYLDIARRK
jgi:hypothetical protein